MNGSTYDYTNNGPVWFILHDCFASHAILNELSCPLRTVINASNNTVLHSSDGILLSISFCSDSNIFRICATVIIMFICSANIYYATFFWLNFHCSHFSNLYLFIACLWPFIRLHIFEYIMKIKWKKKHNGNSISNDVIVLVIFETFSISWILRKCKIWNLPCNFTIDMGNV